MCGGDAGGRSSISLGLFMVRVRCDRGVLQQAVMVECLMSVATSVGGRLLISWAHMMPQMCCEGVLGEDTHDSVVRDFTMRGCSQTRRLQCCLLLTQTRKSVDQQVSSTFAVPATSHSSLFPGCGVMLAALPPPFPPLDHWAAECAVLRITDI